ARSANIPASSKEVEMAVALNAKLLVGQPDEMMRCSCGAVIMWPHRPPNPPPGGYTWAALGTSCVGGGRCELCDTRYQLVAVPIVLAAPEGDRP
ncbi:MAG TPA: hypothetical protein VKU60_15705, partial [Chloroflexota bacterium]|nr:hypothetical protein [Chloroflexota bacterium]